MAGAIPDSLQKHGRNPSPEWLESSEEYPKVARGHMQEGNGIIYQMLGSRPTAACQFLKNDNKREQDLKE